MESSLSKKDIAFLETQYYNPRNPASFGGFSKFWKYIKNKTELKKHQVQQWLLEQDIYTSFYPKRTRFKRPQTISPKKDVFWQSDTAYMTAFQDSNDGYAYFAVFIDVFTRFCWTKPMKSLKGLEMKSVIEDIFQESKCRALYTDAGSEYVNRSVAKLLKDNGVKHFIARSDTKASMAERVIKTIKLILFKYMDRNNTHRWIDMLPDVTAKYNDTIHSAIKMSPSTARQSEPYDIWKNQFRSKPRKRRIKKPSKQVEFKFSPGDTVKILAAKKPFQREYDQSFTTETFTITERAKKGDISLYKIKDFNNQPIIGNFQDNELVSVIVSRDKLYKIDKVIKQRKRKGVTEYLVSWKGWPKQFNSWVTDISSL